MLASLLFYLPPHSGLNSVSDKIAYVMQTEVESLDGRLYLVNLATRALYAKQKDVIESIHIYDNETKTVTDIQTRSDDGGEEVIKCVD